MKLKAKRLLLFVLLLSSCTLAFGAGKKFTLVIDAGHGGHDIGAPGSITNEKYINLNVALAFGRYVELNCSDVRVVYTRKTDVFIPLYERAEIANRAKADLFVSIHTNALPGKRIARGLQSYTLTLSKAGANLEVAKRENSVIELEGNDRQHLARYNPNSPENQVMFELLQSQNMERSVEFAKYVQRETCAMTGRADMGVHQANLAVLRLTSMPACLIELGFITTPDEEEFLVSSSGVDMLAKGIFNAFMRYKGKYNDKVVIPFAASENPMARVQEDIGKSMKVSSTQKSESRKVAQTESKKVKNAQIVPEPKDKSKSEQKPVAKSEPKQELKPVTKPKPKVASENKTTVPLFKVQILSVNRMLRPGSTQFKGHKDVDFYKDGNTVKYTIGATTDYYEIARIRKKLLDDFPQAFIIAFKNGERMDVAQAIQEFKQNNK